MFHSRILLLHASYLNLITLDSPPSASSKPKGFDPFSPTSLNKAPFKPDPFNASPSSPSKSSDLFGSDPFGGSSGGDAAWTASFNGVKPKASKSLATSWGDGNDPFGSSATKKPVEPWKASFSNSNNEVQQPKIDGRTKMSPKRSTETASKSLATTWGQDQQLQQQQQQQHDPFAMLPKKVKEKKKHKWVPKLPSTGKGDNKLSKFRSGKASDQQQQQQQQAPAPNVEAVHLKATSDASKRAERERLKRLQLQEEQDLAYAIALSKAEAASLKTN